MKWLKRKDNQTPNNYWDTISDVMSSLLLILMLVMVLLILYVVRAPDYNKQQDVPESVIIYDGREAQYIDREAGHAVIKVEVPYFLPGMEDEEYGRGELTGDFLYEIGGFFDDEFDGHEGAAVRVIIEDAETHNAIPVSQAAFSLYSAEGRLKTLHTFYPNLKVWTMYETDESGSFYLPEKIPLASYILHELTVPAGYEMSEDLSFTLEEPHAWTAPYILHVPLASVRNTVFITAIDSETKKPVMGCVFDIVAAEDITTPDGTVRYSEGTVVDQIASDENGECRSIALYLGNYVIRQSYAPDYYAVSKDSYDIALTAENENSDVSRVIPVDKTRFILNVVDELYSSMDIAGAEFAFQSENGESPATLVSDENGRIVIDRLDKYTSYTLSQTAAPEGYRVNGETVEFYVDENGRIDDKSAYELKITNRTLRLSVLAEDAVFHKPASGLHVSLYVESGKLVKAWYTTDIETTISGLNEGTHRLEITGAGKADITVEIEDTAQVQSIVCPLWTTGNKMMIGVSAAVICGLGLAAFLVIRIIRKRK